MVYIVCFCLVHLCIFLSVLNTCLWVCYCFDVVVSPFTVSHYVCLFVFCYDFLSISVSGLLFSDRGAGILIKKIRLDANVVEGISLFFSSLLVTEIVNHHFA